MKQRKRISRPRIQGNTRKEGKTLMKQLKRISRLKNIKQYQKRRKNTKHLKKEGQGVSMVDPSILDPIVF